MVSRRVMRLWISSKTDVANATKILSVNSLQPLFVEIAFNAKTNFFIFTLISIFQKIRLSFHNE